MESAQSSAGRVVLLGASNLTLGLRWATSAAHARLAPNDSEAARAPLAFFVASGNGRSYGQLSRFLGRVLPGIDACGLWPALAAAPSGPTAALVTDLGNDLAFGASARQVLAWLSTALERLERHHARTVLTGLPLERLERIGAREFRFWSKLLFPFHRIERARLLGEARELDAALVELARARGLARVAPRSEWYGLDPIHVARARRAEAWASYSAPWGGPAALTLEREPVAGRVWYERVRLFGVECGVAQPCARLSRGSTLRLY